MINKYYQQPDFEQALESFVRAKPHWPLRARHDLYRLAQLAFDSQVPSGAMQDAVSEIYDKLVAYWGILRPFSREECWDSNKIIDTLMVACDPVSRSTGLNLMTVDVNLDFDWILDCVAQFEGIHPEADTFPHMPASKLLHFYNPGLFPIFDRPEVWNNVCQGAFKSDYDLFCKQHGYAVAEPSAKFNVIYTAWAAEVVRTADPEIGKVFARWFGRRVRKPDDDPVIAECSQYWGAIFEIAAIGAAHLIPDLGVEGLS